MQELILKYALQNAVKHNGKANPGAIIGKLIAEDPEIKKQMREVQPTIQQIVGEVNAMEPDAQLEKLQEIAPELLEKKKEERDIFSSIHAEGKVITAFPPGPEKYPHIGHAKAILLNYLLAKKHNGRFILRFEDTNPALVKEEFYDIMQENFKWLGVDWDELIFASDHMDLFYKHAEKLVEDGKAYMCSCTLEETRENRMKMKPCACRSRPVIDNVKDWDAFKVMDEGKEVLRLKIDMEHKNSTMRDPTIFRIIDRPHARQKSKFRVWPSYDFQNSIMDGFSGITNRIRSKEFEMRDELQAYIQTLLGYNVTKITSIGRFNLEGVESSGRIIREKIENKELLGWDDPTLTTIVALRRRGFLPEAIKNFVISTGISKSEATLTWDDLIMQNKRLLDAGANRYFFVEDPVEVTIEDAPEIVAEHKLHPDHPERGARKLISRDRFFMAKTDYDSLEDGKLYRFMDCLNFKKQGEKLIFDSRDHETYKREGAKIFHYLPKSDELAKVEIMKPDKTISRGFAEPMVRHEKEDNIIQFERFGFCRVDEYGETLKFWFTH